MQNQNSAAPVWAHWRCWPCRLRRPTQPSPRHCRHVRHGGHAGRPSLSCRRICTAGTSASASCSPDAEGGPTPHVTVDLKGHTLYGSGRGRGVTAFAYPGPAYLQVVNGRVENFEIGVGGDNDTRITNVKLVGNRYRLLLQRRLLGRIRAASRTALSLVWASGPKPAAYRQAQHLLGQQGGRVRRAASTVSTSSAAPSTTIRSPVHATEARVAVSYSRFGKNGTGVLVTNETGEGCADLHKNKFSGNGKTLSSVRPADLIP